MRRKILFVCQHGAAKSVVAAAHFRRLAAERGVAADADSAGLEPDAELAPHVVAGLLEDGVGLPSEAPRRLTREAIASVHHVVTFGCDLGDIPPHTSVTTWPDVPDVSDGYATARSAIVARLSALLDHLDAGPDARSAAG